MSVVVFLVVSSLFSVFGSRWFWAFCSLYIVSSGADGVLLDFDGSVLLVPWGLVGVLLCCLWFLLLTLLVLCLFSFHIMLFL